MILRRLSTSIRNQDWFTVVIETLIVVFGVFIGIQLGNWNEARGDRERYEEAREQLVDETEANIRIVDTYLDQFETRLAGVRAAIAILRACETGPEAERTVERGLDMVRSTPFLTLQTSAIAFLTENEKMLAIQDETERLRLQAYYLIVRRILDSSGLIGARADRSPVEDHPMVGYGEISADYQPANLSDERPLILVAPLEAACQDAAFAKHFYLSERIGVFAGLIGERLRDELQANLDILETSAP